MLPLTDPLVLLQVFRQRPPPRIGGTDRCRRSYLVFYLLVGGRVYCSWVCPINIVTDAAEWLRRKTAASRAARTFSDKTRYWLLGAILLVAAVSGSVAWELVNPVSMVYRGLVFGMGLAWGVVAAVFLLDLFRRAPRLVWSPVSGRCLLRPAG